MNMRIIPLLLLVLSLEARGGGGGGGRGGGGGARGSGPSHSFDRTPSMSRSMPASSYQARRDTDSARDLGSANRAAPAELNRPRNTTFQADARRQATPEETAQFRNAQNALQSGLNRNVDGERAAFYNRHPDYNNWFNRDFYDRYNRNPAFWNARADYWRRNAWNDYNSWLGYGWGAPYYYDDSDGLYYSYNNDNSQPADSQAAPPATQGYVPQPNEWYPIGIFALSSSPETASTSNFVYQLALNRQGEVGGTLYNTSTNLVYDVEGALNKGTQAVSFRVANDSAPIMSTGLYNLTQDQTQILVQFADGSKQTWTLTRLKK
ncbi:MAG: hypothetical protein ACK4HV_02875 [Parachlamydiaceae bacterium]